MELGGQRSPGGNIFVVKIPQGELKNEHVAPDVPSNFGYQFLSGFKDSNEAEMRS